MAIIAKETCFEPLYAATSGVSPSSIRLTIFSSITIASSTTIPIASTSAIRVNKLIEKSKKYIDKKVDINETGKAIMGTIKDLIFPKNK